MVGLHMSMDMAIIWKSIGSMCIWVCWLCNMASLHMSMDMVIMEINRFYVHMVVLTIHGGRLSQ